MVLFIQDAQQRVLHLSLLNIAVTRFRYAFTLVGGRGLVLDKVFDLVVVDVV